MADSGKISRISRILSTKAFWKQQSKINEPALAIFTLGQQRIGCSPSEKVSFEHYSNTEARLQWSRSRCTWSFKQRRQRTTKGRVLL